MLQLNLKPCRAPAWAPNGHLQTLWSHFLASEVLSSRGERWTIPLEGGDKLIASYLKGETETLVYLFHGLSGSTDADYMQRTALVASRRGHSVLLVNHRGCGE